MATEKVRLERQRARVRSFGGPGRRTSRKPRERGVLEKASEAIARATGLSSRVRSPVEVAKDLAKRGAYKADSSGRVGKSDAPEKKAASPPQSPNAPRRDTQPYTPRPPRGPSSGASAGSAKADTPKKEAKPERPYANSRADKQPAGRAKPPSTTASPPTGAGRSDSKPTPSPAAKSGRPKGSVGEASNRDLPSKVYTKYKGSGNEHRYGPPVPLNEGKTSTPNKSREAKGPPTKLTPEVKKGFFASLFNAREGASTRDEYDRTGFKRKPATSP